MSNKINVGLALKNLDIGKEITGFGGVILHAGKTDEGQDIEYTAGDLSGNSGYVLETENPIGTQEMANAIFASLLLRGATYRAFTANTVHIDPAFEVGDGITANDTDAVIWSARMNFGRQTAPNLGAPFDEEIDHEFQFVPKQEREFLREAEYTRSRFAITATEISAKVSKEGGDPSSFGWTLTDHDWTLYSNGQTVLKATSAGIEVNGTITATAGVIGGVRIENGVLSGITDTNIAQYGISGGDYGSILGESITDYNVTQAINSGVGYGALYGAAINGTPEGDYYAVRLHLTDKMVFKNQDVGWVTVGGQRVLGQLV